MKKKKGFTLIELLAVIVVLAIIALIATPIVMNTIKNSKKGAAERSGESYVKQVETAIMEYRMESGNTLPDGEYQITSDGNLCRDKGATCSDKDKITIEMSGTKPSGGTITIKNGQVSTTGTSMEIGDYTVSYDSTKKTYVATEKGGNNVEVLCTANTTNVRALVWDDNNDPGQASSYKSKEVGLLASESGAYTPGVTYTCNVGDGERTFYVLEESGDNVSLILGTNLGDTVAWVSKEDYIAAGGTEEDWSNTGNYHKGPVTANKYLKDSTESWTKLNSSQISLPTYDQIHTAAGNITSGFPTWLNSYTDENVSYGYWTSTPIPPGAAHLVFYGGAFSSYSASDDSYYGIRPVITISKTQLG